MSIAGHQIPPIFRRGPSPLVQLLLLVSLSLLLLIADLRFRYLDMLRQGLSLVTYPLQMAATQPADFYRNASVYFSTLLTVQLENAQLRRTQLDAAQRLLRYEEIERENAHLRELLGMSRQLPVKSFAADILYNARDPYARKVIIDRGTQHGLEAGLLVVDERGIVGQVTRVYPIQAEVTLITDKSSAMPVKLARTGQPGVVYGVGDGTLELRFQLGSASIEVGDQLVTSGLDGVFLPGLPVAEVVQVEREGRAFARIVCKPLAAVERIGQVLVLGRYEPPPPRPVEPEPKVAPRRAR